MKSKILLVGFLAAMITGCSTYRAGQTPDDVYYSPAREAKERTQTQSRRTDRYDDYVSHEDDRYLRMKTRNRERWSTIDDYDYWNDSRYVPSYSYNYYRNNWNNLYLNNWNTGYYQPYNNGTFGYSNWGGYPGYNGNGYSNRYGYSGYGSGAYSKTPVYITKRPVEVSRPELNSYNNRNYNNRNSLGNSIMKAFTPSNSENSYSNSNTRTYSGNNTSSSSERTSSAPERTYTPSSSNSSSSSSSGSSGSGVSRPARNGGN